MQYAVNKTEYGSAYRGSEDSEQLTRLLILAQQAVASDRLDSGQQDTLQDYAAAGNNSPYSLEQLQEVFA